MHYHMQDHARRAMCVTGAAFGSIAVRCWLHDETVELEAYSEPNNTSMCIWAKRHKTKLPKAIMTRKLQLSWWYKIATQLFWIEAILVGLQQRELRATKYGPFEMMGHAQKIIEKAEKKV